MLNGWSKIFRHEDLIQVKLAEDVLKQNNIISQVITKRDSVIPSHGLAELFTHDEDVKKAVEILKKKEIILA